MFSSKFQVQWECPRKYLTCHIFVPGLSLSVKTSAIALVKKSLRSVQLFDWTFRNISTPPRRHPTEVLLKNLKDSCKNRFTFVSVNRAATLHSPVGVEQHRHCAVYAFLFLYAPTIAYILQFLLQNFYYFVAVFGNFETWYIAVSVISNCQISHEVGMKLFYSSVLHRKRLFKKVFHSQSVSGRNRTYFCQIFYSVLIGCTAWQFPSQQQSKSLFISEDL